MPNRDADVPTPDRLLIAGAQLLDAAQGSEVSTRAICERAGVQAPTLYHHFGSRQGLLDKVVSHGFRRYLDTRRVGASAAEDPLDAIREGWDAHVRFGVEHPAFYAHIYGRLHTRERCGVVSDVEAMILETLQPAARAGRLAVSAPAAAADILAASSGVVLTLITAGGTPVDNRMSVRVRDAILRSITIDDADTVARRASEASIATAAAALLDALDGEPTALSASETSLLRDWLSRLSASGDA